MKKILIAAAGIAALAATGWIVLWFAGRDEIDTRLDQEIALLAARGVEITHGGREIGGFPFAYRVTHRDVTIHETEFGGIYRLPEIVTEVTANDPFRLITRMPEKFIAEVPVPPEADYGTDVMRFDVEAENLVVIKDGGPGERQQYATTADSMLVVTGGKDQRISMAFDFVGLNTRAFVPDSTGGDPVTSASSVERLDYAYTATSPVAPTVNFEGSVERLKLTTRSDVRDQAGLQALLAGAGGSADMTYQTSASKAAVHVMVEEGKGQGGLISVASGSTVGTLSVGGGQMQIAASSRVNEMLFSPEPALKATGGKPLGAALNTIEAIYKIPFAPSRTMSPFNLRFVLDGLVPDESLWQLMDPAKTVVRDPAQLIVDLEGTARLTKQFADIRPGEAPPVEVGNVSVKALDVNALGASVTTRGDVEFLQPAYTPHGTLTVTLTNVMNVVSKLIETGLVKPQFAQAASAMLAVYTTPGAGAGERIAKVEMGLDGITVNGQPVGSAQ